MKEKIPHSNIVDLEQKRLERENAKHQKDIGVSSDGFLTFPQETREMTIRGALDIARDVLQKYADVNVLEQDFFAHEKSRLELSGINFDKRAQERTRVLFIESLENQTKSASLSSTDSIVDTLEYHAQNPGHFYATLLVAMSHELKRRFP